MIDKFRGIFKIPELRNRIKYTLLLLIVYRIGGHIFVPGIDAAKIQYAFQQQSGTLFQLYDLFAGGNLSRASIFALGIMPYISASIILQLLAAVVPYFERLQKEGEEGKKKITQYTRYGTVILSVIQGFGIATFLQSAMSEAVINPGMGFKLMTVISLAAGTSFIMWLGEQITERGIGNGISLIIFIGIIARYPTDILQTITAMQNPAASGLNFPKLIVLLILMVGVVVSIIAITQGQRRITVQYAKRVIGRRIYGGQSTHIPLRVNTAGVIPIIFAQSIMMFPNTLISFFPQSDFMNMMAGWFKWDHPFYLISYSLMVVFFTYFYTAIIFNPVDIAENMKKSGGFIPGIRPGKKTADYIDRVLTRITLPGGVYLALIAVIPVIFMNRLNAPFYFGGTGLLIVVGVALDTLQQIESHLILRHYDGFMAKGKLRGRR